MKRIGMFLGIGLLSLVPSALAKRGLAIPVDVIVRGVNTCALMLDGAVLCWGYNASGNLGIGTKRNTPTPTQVPLPGPAKALAFSGNFGCATLMTGQVFCFGMNNLGQLGTGNFAARNTPVELRLPGRAKVRELMIGQDHACVVDLTGDVYCWGANGSGQVGVNDDELDFNNRNTPTKVSLPAPARTLILAEYASCVQLVSDESYCWGQNYYGELGTQASTQRNAPLPADLFPKRARPLSIGSYSAFLLDAAGKLFAIGNNTYGRFGIGTFNNIPERLYEVPLEEEPSEVASTYYNLCILSKKGNVACAGYGGYGVLGNGGIYDSANLTQVNLPVQAKKIWTYYSGACAWLVDNRVYCWGYNGGPIRSLGLSSGNYYVYTPAEVTLGTDVLNVFPGDSNGGCYLDSIRRLKCWGGNDFGRLGTGDFSPMDPTADIKDLDPVDF